MSAAAARRKKQLSARHAAAAHHVTSVIGSAGVVDGAYPPPSISATNEGTIDAPDPVRLRLDALLYDPNTLSRESVAYEALQLAQSVVRRYIKSGSYDRATYAAYRASLALLAVGGRVAVCSQLLTVLVDALNETRTPPTAAAATGGGDDWTVRIAELDNAHQSALNADAVMSPDERGRLQRLQLQFLRKIVKWSADCGSIKYGIPEYHALLANHAWRMSCDVTVVGDDGRGINKRENDHVDVIDGEEDEDGDGLDINLRNTAVTHYAFAGGEYITSTLLDKLHSLPAPTSEEIAFNHTCPPSQRDALLTRAVLVLLSIENLRDATLLVRSYLSSIEGGPRSSGRTPEMLAGSYLDKTDGVAPSHVMFCCMLLRICEKDAKTAPLFTWLVRNFGNELSTMVAAESIRAYATRIGRVYFDILPPPSMMSMMENMFSGGGGMGGMPGGGMNPAAMMQAMQAMQGGGRM